MSKLLELCQLCGKSTGRCGEDSIYIDASDNVQIGPLCEECLHGIVHWVASDTCISPNQQALAAAKAEIVIRGDKLANQAKEIEQLKRNGAFHVDVCTAHLRHIKELQKELEEQTEQENRHILMAHNVEQTLGRILGYPWYKDDKTNFPDATEEDGVCVGEDTIETLADQAVERIQQLEDEVLRLRIERNAIRLSSDKLAEELKDRDNRIADLTASRDEWRISAKINADAATMYLQQVEELQEEFASCQRTLDDVIASRDAWRISAKDNADEATKHRQRSEERQARVKVLEEAVSEALVAAQAEWNLVQRHPASRFAGDVAYYESVLYPQVQGMLGEDKGEV